MATVQKTSNLSFHLVLCVEPPTKPAMEVPGGMFVFVLRLSERIRREVVPTKRGGFPQGIPIEVRPIPGTCSALLLPRVVRLELYRARLIGTDPRIGCDRRGLVCGQLLSDPAIYSTHGLCLSRITNRTIARHCKHLQGTRFGKPHDVLRKSTSSAPDRIVTFPCRRLTPEGVRPVWTK